MRRLLCMILPLLATGSALGQATVQSEPNGIPKEPEALVRSFYSEVVAHHPSGISIGSHNMKVFAAYLSKTLLHRIDLGIACDNDRFRQWKRRNTDPTAKPPIYEGGLFSGDDLEGEPQAFEIQKVQAEKDGSVRVQVKLTHHDLDGSPWTWNVAVILIRQDDRFVVDDVLHLKETPQQTDFLLSELLSQGCEGSHWIGDGPKTTGSD